MGGGVSKVDVEGVHKAVLAVLKRGPLDDSIRLLKQNADIRYREEHGYKPLQDKAGHVVTPVDEIVLSGEQLNKYRRGAGGAARLASALAGDKFVHSVLLDSCGITSRDLHAFCRTPCVLSVHPRITSLDLSGNEIAGIAKDGSGSFDPTALRVLCDALCSNAGLLTELNLSHNVLAAPGAVILADLLVHHHGLQMLNVEGCALEDEGKRAVGTALLRKAAAIEAKEREEAEEITAAAAATAAKSDASHHHHHHRLGRRRSSTSAFAAKEAERQRRKAAARDKKAREALRARVRRSWAKAYAARRAAFESAGRRFEADAKKRRKEAIKKLPSAHKKELAHVKKLAAAEAKAAKRVRDRVEKAKRAALKKEAKALEHVRKQRAKVEAKRRNDLQKARAQLGPRPSLSQVRWVEGMEVEVSRLCDALEQAKATAATQEDEAVSRSSDDVKATNGTSVADNDCAALDNDVDDINGSQDTGSAGDAQAALDMLKAEDELLKEHEHEPCPHRTGIGVLTVVHNDNNTADVNFHITQPQQAADQTLQPSLVQTSDKGNASEESGPAQVAQDKPDAENSEAAADTATTTTISGEVVDTSDGDIVADITMKRLRPARWRQQLVEWDTRDKELQQQESEINEADATADGDQESNAEAGANDVADGGSTGEDESHISVAQAVAEAGEAALQGFPSIQRCEQEIELDRIAMEEQRGEEPQRVEMDDDELDEHLGLGPLGSDLQTRALELLRRPGRNGALEGPGGRWPQLRLIRCDEFDLGALGDEVEELDLFQERLVPADAVLLGGMLVGNDTVMAIDLSSNPLCGRYWNAGEGAMESSRPFRGEFDASGIEALCEALSYEILPPPPSPVVKKKEEKKDDDEDDDKEGRQEGSNSAEDSGAEDETEAPQHESDGAVPVPPEPLGYGRVRSLSIANVGLVSRRFGNHGPVSFAALDALSAALITNTSLTFLDISSNGIVGDWRTPIVGCQDRDGVTFGTGVLGFTNALRRNCTLMTLDMSNNAASLDARGDAKAADEEAITAICDALIRRDIFEQEYNISRDTVSYDEKAPDAQASKCGLTALNLAHNYMKGNGARALARALPFSILEILDISQNRIGASPNALIELGDAMRRAPDLTSLNISHNLLALDACDGIADVYGGESAAAGALRPRRAFCRALAENTLLEELNEENIGTRAAQKHQAEADREKQQALQVWGAPQLPEISDEQLLVERTAILEQCMLRAENET